MKNFLLSHESRVILNCLSGVQFPVVLLEDESVLWANQAFNNFSGIPSSEKSIKKTWEFPEREVLLEVLKDYSGQSMLLKDVLIAFPRGIQRRVNISLSPLDSKNAKRALLIFHEAILNHFEIEKLQRLAEVGNLSHSVYHELKNAIFVWMSLLALLKNRVMENRNSSPTELVHLVDRCLDRSEKVKGIINHVRHYGLHPSEGLERVSLSEVVNSVISMLLWNVQAEIDIQMEIQNVKFILANTCRIEQVVVNLFLNAIDAVREVSDKRSPVILVRVKMQDDCVLLEIQDNGSGVKSEMTDKIFKPFFSTKSTGKGTGLGLYITQNIIQAYGGTLSHHPVKSGEGSLFRVSFESMNESEVL